VKVEAKLEAADAEKITPVPGSLDKSLGGITPKAGSLKGFWMSPDFDAPLEEFKEYME